MRAAFHTLGCKVNQYETEALKEQFRCRGYEIVTEDSPADVYVINTCTVTALADRKSRQYIRRMKKLAPDSIVAVTGCYVQIDPQSVEKIEGVDIVAGTNEKHKIPEYVEHMAAAGRVQEIHIKKYEDLKDYEDTGIITAMESRTRAYIKIEEGCNRFCSYCVIPYARGPVRSRPQGEIIAEAKELVGGGFRELILTGINTALYEDLPGLLGALENMEGDFRVRLSSLEPTVIDADYVQKLFGYERLCHHLHLSLQSGSDRILRAMNRRYDTGEYLKIVEKLRGFDPLYGISTDIIAGFPGETEGDVQGSLRIIKEAEFCRVHVFNYSRRPQTAAAGMDSQIEPSERKRRVNMLMAAGAESAAAFAEKNIGSRTKVIFESAEREQDGGRTDGAGAETPALIRGYTDNYLYAYMPADADDRALHDITEVKVTGVPVQSGSLPAGSVYVSE